MKRLFSSGIYTNGIAIMLGACGCYTFFNLFAKHLVNQLSVGEMGFARFGFGALMMTLVLSRRGSWSHKADFRFLIFRGLLQSGIFFAMLLSYRVSTLSMTVVLYYTSPAWALFFGAYFLDERLTVKRIGGVLVAMLGILVLINPWEEAINPGHLYGLSAGIMGGCGSVLSRYLRRRHDAWMIYAFICFVGTLSSLPLVVGRVHIPEFSDGMMLIAIAVFGLLAQVLMNYGYRFIQAAEGATLMTTEAIFTGIAGIIIFREPLTLRILAGAAMVLGSGVYLGLETRSESAAKMK